MVFGGNASNFTIPPILMVHYRHSPGSKHKSNAHFRAFQSIEIFLQKKIEKIPTVMKKVTNDLIMRELNNMRTGKKSMATSGWSFQVEITLT